MSSWRCSNCNLDWPYQGQYSGDCKVCGTQTWCHSEGVAISVDEAQRLHAQARAQRSELKARRSRIQEFEDWYADQEITRAMATFDAEWSSMHAPPPERAD